MFGDFVDTLKLIVTSDIHIHDWMPYSTFDKYGRPSRLLQYESLSEDIKSLADSYNADMIVIAGDISQISTQRPRVLDIMGNFFRNLSPHPTLVIPGQHDMDTKEDSITRENCILTEVLKDMNHVQYYPTVSGISFKDFKILALPWNSNHEIPDNVENFMFDLFVGHGLVSGARNLDGYIFQSGFKKDDLLSKFKMSIIGDIHNGDVISNNDGCRILIPGTPVQANWKDSPNCGLWYVEISKTDYPKCKFHPIHEIRPDFYHQFIYDGESTDLIHSRPKIKVKKTRQSDKVNIDFNKDSSNVFNICENILNESKLSNYSIVKDFLIEAFENVSNSKDKVISNTLSKSIKVKNFFTIDELELNFDEFPDACVIIGNNGLGKTTIPEAIYWALTGNTTKGVLVNSIKNWNSNEDDEVRVEYTAEINGDTYTFTRLIKNSKPKLFYKKHGEDNTFEAGSIRDTQSDIYDLLGLTDDTIKLFSYFSAERTKLFANTGDSDKNDLISQIVGIDIVDSLKNYSKNKCDEVKKSTIKLEAELSTVSKLLQDIENKLRYQIDLQSKLTKGVDSLKVDNLKYQIKTKETEISKIREEYNKLNPSELPEMQDELKSLTTEQYILYDEISDINSKRYTVESEMLRLKKEFKVSLEGKCPTCRQSLISDKSVEEFKIRLMNVSKDLKGMETADTRSERLKSIKSSISSLEGRIKDITGKQNELNKVHSELTSLNKDLSEISKEVCTDDGLIDYLKKEFEKYSNSVENLKLLLSRAEIDLDCWKWLESKLFKRKGPLVQQLNAHGSKLLQESIDLLLLDSSIKIKITEELNLLGKFKCRKYADYKAMSSGQKRITDVVLMVALNNLFSSIYKLENGVLGLAVYDEILSFLDAQYIELAKNIIDQSVSKKLLIITHDQSLMSMYDSRIVVDLDGSGNTIYRKSWK